MMKSKLQEKGDFDSKFGSVIFSFCHEKIYYGLSKELPHRGGSTEWLQYLFLFKVMGTLSRGATLLFPFLTSIIGDQFLKKKKLLQ